MSILSPRQLEIKLASTYALVTEKIHERKPLGNVSRKDWKKLAKVRLDVGQGGFLFSIAGGPEATTIKTRRVS